MTASAMFTAVAGLLAQSQAISMISDNIANANTTAYKDTTARFSSLVTQAPTATTYQPGGVIAHPFTAVDAQGLLQATSSNTDLAISGDGFFVVNNDANDTGAFTYTRAGTFSPDASGNLENAAGFFLQGQKLTAAQSTAVANGNVNQLTATALASLSTVNISALSGLAKATQNITLAANLPATDTSASVAHAITVPVFDSQGTSHDLTLGFSRVAPIASTQSFAVTGTPATGDTFTLTLDGQTFTTNALTTATPTVADVASVVNAALTGTNFTASATGGNVVITDTTGNVMTAGDTLALATGTGTETFAAPTTTNGTTNTNLWQVAASIAGGTVAIGARDDIIQFNPDGTLGAGTTFNTPGALQVTAWTTGGAAVPQALNFNLGTLGQADGLSQFGGPFSPTKVDQDGLRFGNFAGVTIDQNGIVTANFDNGLKQAIYLIPIAVFPAPDRLSPQSGNTYQETQDSGNFLLQQAGTGEAGQIASSELEGSTVDIATEFSNLIITQRAYEANAKIITTADQMMQTIIQAKQ
jgi:flagellar hook protein FlgE